MADPMQVTVTVDGPKTIVTSTLSPDSIDVVDVGQDLSALALKSNVLELDNTSAFTPTGDYHPATKKYVDNAGMTPSIINVKSHGAVGDGATDDWPACQAAMDAAVAGDTVYFPTGTYFLKTGWLTVKSGVRVEGSSMTSSILLRGTSSPNEPNANEQPCLRISTALKNTTGYAGDKTDIEICHIGFDSNSLLTGWSSGVRQVIISSGGTDVLEDINFHHCLWTDNDVTQQPDDANDSWGILSTGNGGACRNLRVTDCVADMPGRQFIAGGNSGWDGIWIERNYIYHARETAIAITNQTADLGDYKNVHINNNTITGFTNIAIMLGADRLNSPLNTKFANVEITGNTIVGDAYKEGVAGADFGQDCITVQAGGLHVSHLSICNNTVTRQDDSTVTKFRAVRVRDFTGTAASYTLDALFVQPAVDASVSSITFAENPGLPVGAILHMGDGTDLGGRYEVTANASESYTLTRRYWPKGTADAANVPVTVGVKAVGECRNVVIANNSFDGIIESHYANGLTIANNICSKETENQAVLLISCIDADVKNNNCKSGRMEFRHSNQGRCTGNTFGDASLTAGWIQMKSNLDALLGRKSKNDWYVSGNAGRHGITAANHVTLDQTSDYIGTPDSTSHKLRGDAYSGRTPEGYLHAEIGATCININGGASTTFYVKESNPGDNTGWVGK